jgi:hypothetical protein
MRSDDVVLRVAIRRFPPATIMLEEVRVSAPSVSSVPGVARIRLLECGGSAIERSRIRMLSSVTSGSLRMLGAIQVALAFGSEKIISEPWLRSKRHGVAFCSSALKSTLLEGKGCGGVVSSGGDPAVHTFHLCAAVEFVETVCTAHIRDALWTGVSCSRTACC